MQSTTGDLRERERMWVYRRDRSPCRRCGTPIEVAMLGPAGRRAGDVLVPALPAGPRAYPRLIVAGALRARPLRGAARPGIES